jgi:hypothetical protein
MPRSPQVRTASTISCAARLNPTTTRSEQLATAPANALGIHVVRPLPADSPRSGTSAGQRLGGTRRGPVGVAMVNLSAPGTGSVPLPRNDKSTPTRAWAAVHDAGHPMSSRRPPWDACRFDGRRLVSRSARRVRPSRQAPEGGLERTRSRLDHATARRRSRDGVSSDRMLCLRRTMMTATNSSAIDRSRQWLCRPAKHLSNK